MSTCGLMASVIPLDWHILVLQVGNYWSHERTAHKQSINQSILLFSNARLQSGSHKADVDLQRTNEM